MVYPTANNNGGGNLNMSRSTSGNNVAIRNVGNGKKTADASVKYGSSSMLSVLYSFLYDVVTLYNV